MTTCWPSREVAERRIVSDLGASVSDRRARMLTFYQTWLSIKTLEVPTIATINGHAVEDMREGISAAAAKRPPVFRGH